MVSNDQEGNESDGAGNTRLYITMEINEFSHVTIHSNSYFVLIKGKKEVVSLVSKSLIQVDQHLLFEFIVCICGKDELDFFPSFFFSNNTIRIICSYEYIRHVFGCYV